MSKDARKHSDNRKKKSNDVKLPKVNPLKNESTKQKEEKKKQLEPERYSSLESMMTDIERRQNQYENRHNSDDEQDTFASEPGQANEKSRKTFYREFKKVIDASDIIIEVLDARDPLGCRCFQVEETVLTSGKSKKLILLLNKIDLIPRENLDKWLKYLRNEFPTVAFRASTQNQRYRLGHIQTSLKNCDEHIIKVSNKCIGASTLMNLLSNYCRKNNIKTSITVGVVGFPNVGKSSVINSLKRSQACETGAMPGLTKQMQTVKIDRLIKIFDSPGIVMSKEIDSANLILRNCVRIETIENPMPAIELLLNRCTKEQLIRQYDLNDFQNSHDLLSQIAAKTGSLRRGGIPDIDKAAHRVLSDWTHGKLTYFTEPPERKNTIINVELLTQMREEFDIDNLLTDEFDELQINEEENSQDSDTDNQDNIQSIGNTVIQINDTTQQ